MSGEGVTLKGSQYGATESLKLNGPPGTGKTTQLLERTTALLDDGYTPRDVAFVTYRKEMAGEFLRRLQERGYIEEEAAEKPWKHDTRHFGTIHGVCNRMTADSAVVENKHRRDFIQQEYHARYDGRSSGARGGDGPYIGELLFDAYDWCVENKQHSFVRAPGYKQIKDTAISPPSFNEFDEAWRRYCRDGNEDGKPLQDFASMLRDVDERGVTPPADIVIVDEYHDMTPIMASICESWMESADISIVGGDPLQAIYSYKGADPSFFTGLDLPEVLLDRTYRVPSDIWQYARGVIRHDPPEVEPDSSGGEVRSVAGEPHEVVSKYGGGSTMFLARTKQQLYTIAEKLRSRGIIFRAQEQVGGWNNAALRLNLYNALQKIRDARPADNINPKTGQSSVARYEDGVESGSVRLPANIRLDSPEASALVEKTPAGYFSTTKKSLQQKFGATSTVKGEELLSVVEPSFWTDMTNGEESVSHLLVYDQKPALKAALAYHDRPFPSIETAPVPDVLTIHASKGKEADTVALYDGIPGAVQRNIRGDPREKRAESRVWYVACTRAAETLLVFRDQFDYCDRYLPPVK